MAQRRVSVIQGRAGTKSHVLRDNGLGALFHARRVTTDAVASSSATVTHHPVTTVRGYGGSFRRCKAELLTVPSFRRCKAELLTVPRVDATGPGRVTNSHLLLPVVRTKAALRF